MLEILDLDNRDLNYIETVPQVFIDSIHIEEEEIKVFLSIDDVQKKWLNDQFILENLYVFVKYNDKEYSEKLISIKNKFRTRNNVLKWNISFPNIFPNSQISAYCGDSNLIGVKTTEKVLINNLPISSFTEINKYNYINKIIDLRILNNNILLPDNNVEIEKDQYENKIFVSNTTNKKSKIGYIFDLEKTLSQKSHTYLFFKKYEKFKNSILSKIKIKAEDISFFKKNISIPYQEYEKIISPIKIIKLDDNEHKYFITIDDTNKNYLNRNKYKLKISISFKDYSNLFFRNNILYDIQNSKKYINYYKVKLEDILNNNLIEDPYTFFYENLYEQEINSIETTIEKLSDIYSFYYSKDKNEFYSLFINIFHPLITDINLISQLLNNIEYIEAIVSKTVEGVNSLGEPGIPYSIENILTNDEKINIEKEFSDKIIHQIIDYDYDASTGYEVISSDSYDVRKNESDIGLKIITEAERNTRKILEDGKLSGLSRATSTNENRYLEIFPRLITSNVNYPSEMVTQGQSTDKKYLSISSIDILGSSSYLLDSISNFDISFFNNMFLSLKQYNSDINQYQVPEAYYFDVLHEDVNVNNISRRRNKSVNNLETSTLFDPNLDSQQDSLTFLINTGIESLSFYLDENKFKYVPEEIKKINVNISENSPSTNDTIISDIEKNPFSKPKMIVIYNNFFEEINLYYGQNYGLFYLSERVLNSIFSKKLKHFNQFYLIKFKDNIEVTPQQVIPDFLNELKYNIPSKYLNRVTEESKILITTSEL